MKIIVLFFFVVLIIVYFVKLYFDKSGRSLDRINYILLGFFRVEEKISFLWICVVLGFGGCEDLIVDGMLFFEKFNLEVLE